MQLRSYLSTLKGDCKISAMFPNTIFSQHKLEELVSDSKSSDIVLSLGGTPTLSSQGGGTGGTCGFDALSIFGS